MKRNLTKRIFALFLALILAYPLSVPVLAEDAPTTPKSPSVTVEDPNSENSTTEDPAVSAAVSITSTAKSSGGGDGPIFTAARSANSITLTAELTLTPADTAGTTTEWDWSVTTGTDIVSLQTTNTSEAQLTLNAVGSASIQVTATVKNTTGTVLASDSAECTVVVQYDAAESVTLSYSALTLNRGDSQSLDATVSPDTADPTNLTWTTSNASVATVTSNTDTPSTATVTAKAPGTASITASSGDIISNSCTVTVPGITLSSSSVSIVSGNTRVLTTQLFGNIGSTVEWTSGNTAIAQVSNGTITGIGVGSTTVTATVKDSVYSAVCTVTVKENTAGQITAEATAGLPLSFSSLVSEIDDACQSLLDSSLSYVTNLSVPTQAGILYYNYAAANDTGTGVGSENYYVSGDGVNRLLENVSFVPSNSYTGSTADISYTGFNKAGTRFSGIIRVTISKPSSVDYATIGTTPVRFQIADFNSICRSRNGYDMDSVTFTLPSASSGTLYYSYAGSSLDAKVSSSTTYYRSTNPSLGNISFVPASGFSGTVSIPYTGRDTQGYSYTGRVVITVSGVSGDLTYQTSQNKAVTFDSSDFNTVCRNATGSYLDYVRFDLPSSSRGTLYYNYTSSGGYDSKVSGSRNYYRSNSYYLSRVSFLPASSYTGTVSIDFTAWSTNGDRFDGTVRITVSAASDGTISYSTSRDSAVEFDVDDFDDLCEDETDYRLNYVRFDLPSSSRGTLYYNYTSSGGYDSKVSGSRNYYRSKSPYLDNISFVPDDDFSGTVSIDFTGYSTDGDRFTGTVEISVGASSDDEIRYSTSRDTAVEFDVDDFDDLCEDETDYHLNYVRFDLPSSSKGTLYYNYTKSGNYDSKVSGSRNYYRSKSPYLDNISFVPDDDFSGTVSIDFTGYSTDGDRFTGTVEISVGASSDDEIRYSTSRDTTVEFDVDDFDDLCEDETDYHLDYVRFDLPSSSKGTLYYNYTKSGNYDSKVSGSRNYYRSKSPYLDNVSFVPDDDFSGTVSIDFTGYSTDGDRFTGTVEISVKEPPSASLITYRTVTAPVAFRLSDFQSACTARGTASFVRASFALPSSNYGQLVYDYSGPARYSSKVSGTLTYRASGSPSLGRITFIPAAGFNGIVTIPYTGQDSRGDSYRGTVQILVTPSAVSSHFQDMTSYPWASASADYLYETGITTGVGSGRYLPSAYITRGDFVLMVCRAFDLNASGGGSFLDVPSDSYYASAIRTAQALGVAQGDGRYFYPQRSLTRQDAALILLRAMQAKGLTVSGGSISSLSAFQDGGAVSGYAGTAVASMVEQGILRGNNSGQLNPRGTLSRAEMAVILHRALTL